MKTMFWVASVQLENDWNENFCLTNANYLSDLTGEDTSHKIICPLFTATASNVFAASRFAPLKNGDQLTAKKNQET